MRSQLVLYILRLTVSLFLLYYENLILQSKNEVDLVQIHSRISNNIHTHITSFDVGNFKQQQRIIRNLVCKREPHSCSYDLYVHYQICLKCIRVSIIFFSDCFLFFAATMETATVFVLQTSIYYTNRNVTHLDDVWCFVVCCILAIYIYIQIPS